MISFVSVDELMSYLRVESTKGERFATRFILVQSCQVWDDLIHKLTFEVDRIVRLSEFCSDFDVFPDMIRLKSYLEKEIANCQSVLLIPLAECIRLDPDSADIIRLLAEWPSHKICRIYVPLLAAEEFFFPEINHVLRYQAGELPEPWFIEGKESFEVIVAPFSTAFTEHQIAKGIKEYLSLWEQNSVHRVWLVTTMAPWLPVQQVRSGCSVRVYQSSFDYVYKNIGWEELREEWGSSQQWEWLAAQIQEGDSLDRVAGRLLKVTDYNADILFNLWDNFDQHKRWLVWLWSKRRSKPGTYLYHVLEDSNNVEDMVSSTIMSIFSLPSSVSISMERKKLLQCLGVNHMPPEFWESYNELTDPIVRLAVLTDLSEDERKQLVLCVGELLTKYRRDIWWEYLEVSFPALAWYLQPAITGDEFADLYFSNYNCCRLKDRVDEELITLINKWADEQLLWGYQSRSDLLAKLRADGAKVLWVDAMGAEWTGLLTQLLVMNGQVECEVKITRANLPTTTEANKEWEDEEEVMRGLDDIAHHYAYKFPDSFLKAIEVIEDVAQKALALLSQHSLVVITSDHGLSRFAAISDVKVDVPKWAKVEARGRYALLQENSYESRGDGLWVMEEGNAYLLTHNQFKGSNGCHGEAHGGATPEEYLIPVIVVRKTNTNTLSQFKFNIVTTPVKLNAKGEGVLTVRCNRKVTSVDLRVAGYTLSGQSDTGFIWSFNLKNWKAGKYIGKLYSANQIIGEIIFEVVKGIIQDDLGL